MNEGSAWSEHRFISFDKKVIFFRQLKAASVFKATMVILHGMGEHGGRYRELAEHLSRVGIACFIPDIRGFGLSGGKRGCVRSMSDYFRDLEVVGRLARAAHPEAPLFVLGHSFGGLLASSWIAASPELRCKGMILSSPNFGIAIHVPRWRHVMALALANVLPDHTEDNGVDETQLTHNPAICLLTQKDPLMHHRISVRLYSEMVRYISLSRDIAAKIRCAALVLQAGEDYVVDRQAAARFFEGLRSTDKELGVYEGLYHEILNETGRFSIFSRIASWAQQRF